MAGRALALVALLAVLPSAAGAAATSSSRLAPSALVAVAELPGGGWAFPLRDDQLGRVAKAFSAAHAVCEERGTKLPAPAAVHASFFTRRGHGLSTVGSLVGVYRGEREAAAVFHAALTPRIAGCLAHGMTGSAAGTRIEAWVVPSPLARVAPGSRAARIVVDYAAGAERWRGHLDLVDVRAGNVWALYLFFATETAQADRYELALLRRVLPLLAGTRATQASAASANRTQLAPLRQTLRESMAFSERALELNTPTCAANPVTLQLSQAALDESIKVMFTLDSRFIAGLDAEQVARLKAQSEKIKGDEREAQGKLANSFGQRTTSDCEQAQALIRGSNDTKLMMLGEQ